NPPVRVCPNDADSHIRVLFDRPGGGCDGIELGRPANLAGHYFGWPYRTRPDLVLRRQSSTGFPASSSTSRQHGRSLRRQRRQPMMISILTMHESQVVRVYFETAALPIDVSGPVMPCFYFWQASAMMRCRCSNC